MRRAEPVRRARVALILLACAALAGCAALDPEGGSAPVNTLLQQHGGHRLQPQRTADDIAAAQAQVQTLLAQPLTVDAAVQVALLNHRGLQAQLAQLGVASAELTSLGRLPNPGFSFGRSRRGDEREIERGLHFNLGALLVRPLVVQAEGRRLAAQQQQTAASVLAHVAEVRKAWVRAVAAQQTGAYMHQVQDAAAAGAELARRMAEAGNFSRLQRAREHSFSAEAALNLARAQQSSVATRERLNRLLGLWGPQLIYTLPERLPDLPPEGADRPDIEREALATRLDLRAAQSQVQASARGLGLTRATRFVNVLEFGLMHNTSNEAPRQTGWEIGFEIPLFDFGDARLARAEGLYLQQVHSAAAVAVQARSEVRESWHAQRTAWDIARHYRDEIVPAAKRISDENLLRYNGMFIGVFELLADARSQVAAVNESINALRDFWVAQAELDMALLGPATMTEVAAPSTSAAEAGKGH